MELPMQAFVILFYFILPIYSFYVILFFLQFDKASEHTSFSCSVTDVFTQLNQCLNVIDNLECPHQETQQKYMRGYSNILQTVLTAYAEKVKQVFPVHIENHPKVNKKNKKNNAIMENDTSLILDEQLG